jgi:hypothetical protein
VYDHDAIAGGVDIELDRVGADVNRLLEGRDGILGEGLVRTPVRDGFGALP